MKEIKKLMIIFYISLIAFSLLGCSSTSSDLVEAENQNKYNGRYDLIRLEKVEGIEPDGNYDLDGYQYAYITLKKGNSVSLKSEGKIKTFYDKNYFGEFTLMNNNDVVFIFRKKDIYGENIKINARIEGQSLYYTDEKLGLKFIYERK